MVIVQIHNFKQWNVDYRVANFDEVISIIEPETAIKVLLDNQSSWPQTWKRVVS